MNIIEIDRVAVAVARQAKSRARWMDQDDLLQVARLAVLEASRLNQDEAYLAAAAHRQVRLATSRAWCPVTVGAKSGEAARLRFAFATAELPELVQALPCPVEASRVREAAADAHRRWPLGLEVLAGGLAREVAVQRRVGIRDVYRQTAAAKAALRAQPELQELVA